MIRVQCDDFDIGRELDRLAASDNSIGGVASFVGLVRDMGGPDRVSALTLEHYPGMTEKKLPRSRPKRTGAGRFPLR